MKKLLIAGALLASSFAQASDYIETASAHDVPTTVQRLTEAAEGKGLTVFKTIDHAAGARSIDMALAPSQVVIFGNPKLGTVLMQANPAIAVDLPLKIAVWENADGKTMLSYRSAASLAEAHGMDPQAKPFQNMAGALKGLTAKAGSAD